MNRDRLHLPPATLLLALASCSTLPSPSTTSDAAEGTDRRSWAVGAFHRDVEIDSVDFDDREFAETTLDDQDRTRTGMHGSYGTEVLRGFLEVFQEEFLGADDGVGLTVGVEGRPRLHTLENGVDLVLPYRFGGTFVDGGDTEIARAVGDFYYLEAAVEAGVGLVYRGFLPSIGFTSKSFTGNVDFEGEDGDDFSDDDFESDFVSGYVELAYRPAATGIDVSLRGLTGEEQGAYVSLNWGF